jgi:hypothetical protein
MESMLERAGFTETSILPRITFADYLDPSVMVEAGKDGSLFDRIVELERKATGIEGSAALGGHLLVKARKGRCRGDTSPGQTAGPRGPGGSSQSSASEPEKEN